MPTARKEKEKRKMNIVGVLIPWVLLIVGLVLLIKGADWFVDGASGLATRMRIPTLVIGMTIVAFGTSAPEAAVSITSALQNNGGIAMGNVVGSNLFNLLMVVGGCAIIRSPQIDKAVIKKDFPYNILATVVLLFALLDVALGDGTANVLSRTEGLIIIAFFSIFMYYTIVSAISGKTETVEVEKKVNLGKLIVMLVVGIAAIITGGQAVVNGASDIARSFGVSETLIGLTIVAVGTSLPELVTSLVAVKKGEDNIAIGNVIGSNVFNILFIIGIGATIRSISIDNLIVIDTVILLAISTLFYAYIAKKKTVSRPVGIAMVLAYVLYVIYAIVR